MSEIGRDVVEALLEGELIDHLGFEKSDHKTKTIDNTRNRFTTKRVQSKYGIIDLSVPTDRKSEF